MKYRLAAVALLMGSLGSVAAMAQSDPMATARSMAANQLGLLEYCQSQGDVGPDAVAAQHGLMARLPVGAPGSMDAPEALGKQGMFSANGTNTPLASLATGHNTTVSALCGQMGSSVIQVAKSMPAAAGPSMTPNMPPMPSMPSMPTMPSMPSVPSAPATTQ